MTKSEYGLGRQWSSSFTPKNIELQDIEQKETRGNLRKNQVGVVRQKDIGSTSPETLIVRRTIDTQTKLDV